MHAETIGKSLASRGDKTVLKVSPFQPINMILLSQKVRSVRTYIFTPPDTFLPPCARVCVCTYSLSVCIPCVRVLYALCVYVCVPLKI